MSRGSNGRYGYQASADPPGLAAVTCGRCGAAIGEVMCRYVRKVPTGETWTYMGVEIPVMADDAVTSCWPCRDPLPDLRPCSCRRCGRTVYYNGYLHVRYCTPQCLRSARLDRRRRAELARHRRCSHCGSSFTAPRRDAGYCSPRCRQAAYRKRLADQAAADTYAHALMADYNNQLNGG